MPRVFDGTGDYLQTAFSDVIIGPLTMACWCYPNPTATDFVFALTDTGSADNYWNIAVSEGTTNFHFRAADSGAAVNSNGPGTYSVNTWEHVGGVAANAAGTLRNTYHDGTAGANQTTALTPDGADSVNIGGLKTSGALTGALIGRVFWAAIWDVALSAADMLRLAQGVEPVLVRRDALKFYAPLEANEDRDKIGGLALTVNGNPTFTTTSYPDTMIRAVPRGRGRSRSRFE